MELFLTLEVDQEADKSLGAIMNEINSKLDFITNRNINLEEINNYGTEFQSIGIIPTCMSDEFLSALGWKERKLIKRKAKEADIRLIINHDDYLKASPEKKRLIYIKTIIDSIKIVQEKSKGDFRGNELIEDILKALNVTMDQLNFNQ